MAIAINRIPTNQRAAALNAYRDMHVGVLYSGQPIAGDVIAVTADAGGDPYLTPHLPLLVLQTSDGTHMVLRAASIDAIARSDGRPLVDPATLTAWDLLGIDADTETTQQHIDRLRA